MPDTVFACVASFEVSEDTPPAGGSRAVSGEVQFFERPFLKPFPTQRLFTPGQASSASLKRNLSRQYR
jgi:hypothetical protein